MEDTLKCRYIAKLYENELDFIMSKSKCGEIYRNALDLYNKKQYIKAIKELKKIGNYKDSQTYIAMCRYNELKKKESLNDAILRGNFEKIEFLLEDGINPNSCRVAHTEKGDSYYTPLGDCISKVQNIEIARLLINYGANVNGVDKIYFRESYEERYMLHQAVFTENYDMVKLLLEYGADVNLCRLEQVEDDIGHYTVLSDCVRKVNSVKIAELIIKYGVDVNAKDVHSNNFVRSILYYAVDEGNYEMVKLLLENGVVARDNYEDEVNFEEMAILRCSAKSKNCEMVKLLLECGSDTRYNEEGYFKNKNYRENIMLPVAVYERNYEIVELLLARGGNPNLWTDKETSNLLGICISSHYANKSENKRRLEIAKLLIKYGANVNVIFRETISGGYEEISILNHAILLQDYEMVKILLVHGASIEKVRKQCVDGKYTYGMCMLGEAIVHCSGENLKKIVEVLLENGASMDDSITLDGITCSIKEYPFLDDEKREILKEIGWRGHKISTHIKRGVLSVFSKHS